MIPTHNAHGSHMGHLEASNDALRNFQCFNHTSCDMLMRFDPTRVLLGTWIYRWL